MPVIAAVCLCGAFPALADPLRELSAAPPSQAGRLRLPASITLDLIRPVELLPGGALAVAFSGSDLAATPVNRHVFRALPVLWSIDVEPGGSTAYQAQYDLIGADGRAGGLSLVSGNAFVPVVLEPIAPTASRAVDGSVRLEGGLKLHFSLDGVKRSGDYGGTLIVTLHRF